MTSDNTWLRSLGGRGLTHDDEAINHSTCAGNYSNLLDIGGVQLSTGMLVAEFFCLEKLSRLTQSLFRVESNHMGRHTYRCSYVGALCSVFSNYCFWDTTNDVSSRACPSAPASIFNAPNIAVMGLVPSYQGW